MTVVARYPVKKALSFGCIAAVVIGIASSLVHEWVPMNIYIDEATYSNRMIPTGIGIVTSILAGMALGSYFSLLHENKGRLKSVFRPNKGRLLAAFLLALTSAFTSWTLWPTTFAWAIAIDVMRVIAGATGHSLLPTLLKLVLVGLPISYIVSSLIIAGSRSKSIRFLLFVQAWLATYAAMILLHGLPGEVL